MKKDFGVKTGLYPLPARTAAAGTLLAFAVLSVFLACLGAESALVLMRSIVAQVVVAGLAVLTFAAALRRVRRPSFAVVLHLGFALVLGGWLYNAWCGEEGGYLDLHAGRAGAVADAFEFQLEDFSIDRWEDTGTVRQYTSRGWVRPRGGTERGVVGEPVTISVNHPLVRDGWWVYQSSYKEMRNPHTGRPFYFTILQCVKDVGLPWVAGGALLLLLGTLWGVRMLGVQEARESPPANPFTPREKPLLMLEGLVFLGAVAMLVHRGLSTGHAPLQNMYEFLMCMAALLPLLTWVSAKFDRQNTLLVDAILLALVMIPVGFVMDGRVKHLMPALQSPFFVPHVGAYVLGYVLLIRAALGAGRRLVGVGFFLLTVGLVLGAAWGKVCWGNWWQFDPKEMWSLATWFVYLAYFHVAPKLTSRARNLFLLGGAVMIVLTLTWINLSRIFTGMHSYA